MIARHGGPWNGSKIEDVGTNTVRVGIADRYDSTPDGPKPSEGANIGYAVYEFDDRSRKRTEAFWLENKWEGICEKNGGDCHG